MRLQEKTQPLREGGRRALVAFLTAGYPDEETFVALVRACDRAGCDVVEVGIPFSDPIADGPAIQASSGRALAGGMTLERALGRIAGLSREVSCSLVTMSYVNPVLAMGLERFVALAADAGVAGTIFPDVPQEEAAELRDAVRGAGLDYVHLLAPTSSDERIARIAAEAGGFLYLVSVAGVTGARAGVPEGLDAFVARARRATAVPLYVGFGVSSPDQAARVAQSADGVIIGSRLVRIVEEAGDAGDAVAAVRSFLEDVRGALDAVPPGARDETVDS